MAAGPVLAEQYLYQVSSYDDLTAALTETAALQLDSLQSPGTANDTYVIQLAPGLELNLDSSTIEVNSSVHLVSASAAAPAVLSCNSYRPALAIALNVSYVKVQGLRIRNCEIGITTGLLDDASLQYFSPVDYTTPTSHFAGKLVIEDCAFEDMSVPTFKWYNQALYGDEGPFLVSKTYRMMG